MQKVIVIGATSGMGRGLAALYADKGSRVGIVGRRENLLRELYLQHTDRYIYKIGDVTHSSVNGLLDTLYQELDGLDLLIISAGAGEENMQLEYKLEEPAIYTNVVGFTNIIDWGYKIFEKQGKGHLVVISSIAGIRGSGGAPAYNASKAYQINYTEGLRQKAFKQRLPIAITDVRPGFVDTAMAKGDGLFWVAPLDKAVRQIYQAILKKKKIVYVSKRWRYVALLLRLIPTSVYCRM